MSREGREGAREARGRDTTGRIEVESVWSVFDGRSGCVCEQGGGPSDNVFAFQNQTHSTYSNLDITLDMTLDMTISSSSEIESRRESPSSLAARRPTSSR